MKRLSACKVLWSTFRWIGALPVKLLARCCKSFSFSRSFGFNNLRSVEVFQPNLWSCSVTHDDSALRRVDNCDEVVSINCPHSSVSWIIVNRNRVEKCWWWVFISRQICFLIFNEEYSELCPLKLNWNTDLISPSSFVSPLTCQDWRVDENISVSSLQHYKVNQVTRSYKRRWFCKHNSSPQQPDNWCLIHTGKFQPKNRHFCTFYATFLVSKGLLNRLVLITLAFIDWKYNYFAPIRVDWMTPRLHEPTL